MKILLSIKIRFDQIKAFLLNCIIYRISLQKSFTYEIYNI